MLKAEARWLKGRLRTIDASPILDVGSASLGFRTRVQPWIDDLVFGPLRQRGLAVVHQDVRAAEGIDVVADLCDPACEARLSRLRARCVICANVLEHVPDRERFAAVLSRLVPRGGRLLVTVPRAFPYHPDPIDTMFRPQPEELAALFPDTAVIAAEIVSGGRLHDLVLANPRRAVSRALSAPVERIRAALSRSACTGSRGTRVRDWILPWAFKPFAMTCLDLERT